MATRQDDALSGGSAERYTATSTPGGDASSSQIKRDIDRTRAQMDETVDALGNRLQPRHLLDDLIGWVRTRFEGDGADGGPAGSLRNAGSHAWDKLKQHPVPAALIGAGVLWMLLEGDDRNGGRRAGGRRYRDDWSRDDQFDDSRMYSGSHVDARTGEPYAESGYGRAARSESTSAGVSGALSGAKEKAGAALQGAKQAVGGAMKSARGAVGSAGEHVGEWADSARHYTSEATSAAGRYARQGYQTGRDALREASEDYPLAVGVAALAAGVVTGLVIPGTRREDELMGEQSDQLKQSAKQAGEQLLEQGKEAASQVAQTAAEEARGEGLSPRTLVEKVKHVAGAAIEAGSEAAKQEGLSPSQLSQKAKNIAERAKETAEEQAQTAKDKLKPR